MSTQEQELQPTAVEPEEQKNENPNTTSNSSIKKIVIERQKFKGLAVKTAFQEAIKIENIENESLWKSQKNFQINPEPETLFSKFKKPLNYNPFVLVQLNGTYISIPLRTHSIVYPKTNTLEYWDPNYKKKKKPLKLCFDVDEKDQKIDEIDKNKNQKSLDQELKQVHMSQWNSTHVEKWLKALAFNVKMSDLEKLKKEDEELDGKFLIQLRDQENEKGLKEIFKDNVVDQFKIEIQKELLRVNKKIHYLLIQVIDDEIFENDRVIGEGLLILENFDFEAGKKNYCHFPIHDNILNQECGYVNIEGSTNEDGHLEIIVHSIQDIDDKHGDSVKDDSHAKRDLMHFVVWFLYLLVSAGCYSVFEGWNYFKCLYYRIITLFTVGYGDVVAKTREGKVLDIICIIFDTFTLGLITAKAMQYLLELKQKQKQILLMKKKQNEQKKSKTYQTSAEKILKNRASFDERKAYRKMIISSIIVVFLIIFGTLFYHFHEGYDISDSFHWNFVTLTTVGYGDVTPTTPGGKLFTMVYVIIGVTTTIYGISTALNLLYLRGYRKFLEEILSRALVDESQVLEFDMDCDGSIDKYEWLSRLLIDTHACEKKSIDEIMSKFYKIAGKDENGKRRKTISVKQLEDYHGTIGLMQNVKKTDTHKPIRKCCGLL